MNVIELDLRDEDGIILRLNDLFERCDALSERVQNDQRLVGEFKGKQLVTLLAVQTQLLLDYTMIIPEISATKTVVENHIKKIIAITQKNLLATSQRALGERELHRLLDGEQRVLDWRLFQAQLEQYEGEFKTLQQLLISRGYILRTISELYNSEKSDVIV